jgi:hypothetical protein
VERVESAGARARGRREDIEGEGQEGRAIEAGREGEPAILADQGDGASGGSMGKCRARQVESS